MVEQQRTDRHSPPNPHTWIFACRIIDIVLLKLGGSAGSVPDRPTGPRPRSPHRAWAAFRSVGVTPALHARHAHAQAAHAASLKKRKVKKKRGRLPWLINAGRRHQQASPSRTSDPTVPAAHRDEGEVGAELRRPRPDQSKGWAHLLKKHSCHPAHDVRPSRRAALPGQEVESTRERVRELCAVRRRPRTTGQRTSHRQPTPTGEVREEGRGRASLRPRDE